MSLADQLRTLPQREVAGRRTTERYDYQALWGLALIFERHGNGVDYAICFEFHDDLIVLNSALTPTSVEFYQVKTKGGGAWTLTNLMQRKKNKDTGILKPSYIGKLYHDYEIFPNDTEALNFVSNASCTLFSEDDSKTPFQKMAPEEFAKFLAKLREEHPKATEHSASLLHFIKADLSLNDSSTHLKGKLHNLVISELGQVTYNLDVLYSTIVEECRLRSKTSPSTDSFAALLASKAITRDQVCSWLSVVQQASAVPDWSHFATEIDMPALEKAALAREWKSYRAQALDQGNEAVNRIRDRIRKQLSAQASKLLDLTPLMNNVRDGVQIEVLKLVPTLTTSRLNAMILYEVLLYDATGNVQAPNPKPSDKKQ